MQTTIVLFHRNLRIADNRALSGAAERGAVVPVYILNDADPYPPGGAGRWWLEQSLKSLDASLQKLGVSLVLRRGQALDVVRQLIKETGAHAVSWNRRYEPALAAADEKLATFLNAEGVETKIHDGFLLFHPDAIKTGSGTPFKVFTPFSRACFAAPAPPKPIAAPKKLQGISSVGGDALESWKLVPRTALWPKGLAGAWKVSEAAAHDNLKNFIADALADYKAERDRPDHAGTSRLSPYLHFGQISPHQIWYAIQHVQTMGNVNGGSVERYLLEILWREFSWQLLHHFPTLPEKPLNGSFAVFPWRKDDAGLKAWQRGMTGYPLIDAGMRQLWQTGWMHNRVRMIVASFLIKDLLVDWRDGAAWFWDTLVDADLGSNSASWQWVAGCGADAAPFFRIFNPILQGQKFDPNGDYVRHYVPELAGLNAQHIHEPWAAPADVLAKAGIKLGKTYPLPIVQHDKARQRALVALKSLKDPQAQTAEKPDLFG